MNGKTAPSVNNTSRRRMKHQRCIVSLVVFAIIGGIVLFVLNEITTGVYDRFVTPVKQKLIESGYPATPEPRANPAPVPGAFGFGSIELSLPGSEDQEICREDVGLRVKGGGVKIWLNHTEHRNFIPDVAEKPFFRFLNSALNIYPFNRHAPDIAAEVALNDPVKFPLHTPVDNLLKLYGSIMYAIFVPAAAGVADDSYFASVKNPGSFTLIQGKTREDHSAVMMIMVVREDRMVEHLVAVASREQSYHTAYDTILRELRVSETIHAMPESLPECEKEEPENQTQDTSGK